MACTYTEFQNICRELLAASPSCIGWRLEFAEADLPRRWQIKVWSGTNGTFEELTAAAFSPKQLAPLFSHAARVIRELETESLDEEYEHEAVVRAELESALRASCG